MSDTPPQKQQSMSDTTLEAKAREPIAYIQKWVTELIKEASKAEGYTAGEKQVVLMNLHKIDTELQVAKLIMKEDVLPLFSQELSQRDSYWIEKLKEIVGEETNPNHWAYERGNNIREELRQLQRDKLDALIKQLPTDNTTEKGHTE